MDDAQEVAEQYSVMSIPTLILFQNGGVKKQIVGLKSKETLIAELGL